MRIKLTHPLAQVPKRAYPWDAGADLFSVYDGVLYPGERGLFDTGVAIELPDSYVAFVCPRSGLAHKSGVSIVNSPGVIDSGYRDSIKVNLINLGNEKIYIEEGSRIAQLIVQRVEFPDFNIVEELKSSDRGYNGHGSSGK